MNAEGAPPPKAEGWWEDMQSDSKVEGVFQRLECLGRQARLAIQTSDGKAMLLAVRDPSKIVITGGGEKTLSCGAQRPAHKVLVQYLAKPDAKLRTVGDATAIEFR